LELIEKYVHKDTRIKKFMGETHRKNLGPMKSFFSLMKGTDAEYYMFSDQDDLWLPDKVQITLDEMKKTEIQHSNYPCLVHTNLEVVDASLNPMGSNVRTEAHDDLKSLLLANDITGCTVMINDSLKQLSLESIDTVDVMHDMWLGLLATKFGVVRYISTPTMKYRQHGSNVVGTPNGIKNRLLRINSKTEYQRIETSVNAARTFEKLYSDVLTASEQSVIKTVANIGKESYSKVLWSMVTNRVYKRTLSATVVFFVKVALNYSHLSQVN
ncbi:hypothetical protein D1831_14080, partial [Lactiplantibacillus garii]